MKIRTEISLSQLLAKIENYPTKKAEGSPDTSTPTAKEITHTRPVKEHIRPIQCFECKAPKEYPTYTKKGLPKRPLPNHVTEEVPETVRPRPQKVFASKLKEYMYKHPETRKVLQDFRQWRGPQKSSLEAARPSMEEFTKYVHNNPGVEQIVKEHMDFFQRYFERFQQNLRPNIEIASAQASQLSVTSA